MREQSCNHPRHIDISRNKSRFPTTRLMLRASNFKSFSWSLAPLLLSTFFIQSLQIQQKQSFLSKDSATENFEVSEVKPIDIPLYPHGIIELRSASITSTHHFDSVTSSTDKETHNSIKLLDQKLTSNLSTNRRVARMVGFTTKNETQPQISVEKHSPI